MTHASYHAIEAASASGLRLIKQSPAHYRFHMDNPQESTPAQLLGQRVHCAILEPEEFDNRYTTIPEGLDRRTKEGKAIWEQVLATGKEPIRFDDMALIRAMAAAARNHPISRVIFGLAGGMFETPMRWNDTETGVGCKMRPDYALQPCGAFPNGLIVDVKTTNDASPEAFAQTVWRADMAIQAAFYPDGFRTVYQTDAAPAFLWLAIEKDEPHACAYYAAPDHLIEHGRREYRKLIRIYAECLRSNKWPAYSETVQDLVLPVWAERAMEDGMELSAGSDE